MRDLRGWAGCGPDPQPVTGRRAANLTARLQLGICHQIVSRTLMLPRIVARRGRLFPPFHHGTGGDT